MAEHAVSLDGGVRTERRLVSIASGFQLLLMLATRPLWLGGSDFPAVPLGFAAGTVPAWLDAVVVGILVAGVVGLLAVLVGSAEKDGRNAERVLGLVILAAGVMAAFLNQHRFQAWHCFYLTVIAIRVLVPQNLRVTYYQVALAMIYVCAGLSRLGPSIDEGMSRELVSTALNLIGLGNRLQQGLVGFVCTAMTVTETTVGVAILVPRTRRMGLCAAIAMHCTLLLLLGPVGLNHEAGVLLWNAFFVTFLSYLLLSDRTAGRQLSGNEGPEEGVRRLQPATKMVAAWVVLFPLSGLVGIADNWPAWQLYSPRPEVLQVFVHVDAKDQLPESVQSSIGSPLPLDDWCPVRIDRWSLEQTYSAIYPEDRFQLAVAAKLVDSLQNAEDLRAVLKSPGIPDWWNRHETEFADGAAIQAAAGGR
jgi:hypothetical protein